MITGILHLHSLIRWLILILLIAVIFRAFMGWVKKQPFTKLDDKLSLYLMIFSHIQLLTGLTLYVLKDWHLQFTNMKAAMSDDILRFWTVEHLVGMLIAITLITIGRISSKKAQNDTAKYKKLALFNAIAIIIILITIPWAERGLF